MKKVWIVVFALFCASAFSASPPESEKNHLRAKMDGIHETNPSTIISNGTGTFTATINDDSTITFTLSYQNLSAPVTQSHIHIGATKITGGIAIFLCTNLGNGTPGTKLCPNDATHSGTVTHTVTAADVIEVVTGGQKQGIPAGDMADVARAIASGVAYVNVHTTAHPPGEIRGQIRQFGDDEDDELPGAH